MTEHIGTPVIRTWFDDDERWLDVLVALRSDLGGVTGAGIVIIDDPAYRDIDSEELAGRFPVRVDRSVVFVADREGMRAEPCNLLVIDLEGVHHPFRCEAAAAGAIDDNLELDNLGFEDFAAAAEARGGVYGTEPDSATITSTEQQPEPPSHPPRPVGFARGVRRQSRRRRPRGTYTTVSALVDAASLGEVRARAMRRDVFIEELIEEEARGQRAETAQVLSADDLAILDLEGSAPICLTVTPDFQQFLVAEAERRGAGSVEQLLKMLFDEASK